MSSAPLAADTMGGTIGISQPPNAPSGLISCRVIIRNGIQVAVTSPSAVPRPHSTQSASIAAPSPIQSLPRSSVPVPTVISAIAGAPQNGAMTGLFACARARSVCLVQCTAHAAVSATSAAAASAQTTSANTCKPGTRKGSVAAAIATIPVPMMDAYQFGPRSRKTSLGRSRSLSIPNGWCRLRSAGVPSGVSCVTRGGSC